MNEILQQWSPIATLAVVLVAVIGQFLRGGSLASKENFEVVHATALAASTAATNATVASALSTLQSSIDRLGGVLDRIDGSVGRHEIRLTKIETEHQHRHDERRLEVLDIMREKP